MNAAERLALTSLCAELIGLRAEGALQSADKQRLLVRIEEEARARRPILPLLDQLLGTSRTETVRSLGSRLPGAGPGQSDEERFSCPDNVCDRSVVIEPAGAPPRDRSANETRSRWGTSSRNWPRSWHPRKSIFLMLTLGESGITLRMHCLHS